MVKSIFLFPDNMRYSMLVGFLVALLIQHSTFQGVSTPIQFPPEVTYEDDPSYPQEPGLPLAKTVPLLSPSSLKEVQQAMQEASEQVKGHGAEEVLKELLERVVEEALGQVETGGKANNMAVGKQGVEEDTLGVKMGESEAEEEAEALELPQEEMNISPEIRDNGFEESNIVARFDAFINIATGDKEVDKEEGGRVVGSVEETTDREPVGLEVTAESLLEAKLPQEDVDGALEETEGDLEEWKEDSKEQVLLIVLKNTTERETQDEEETPATVEVAVGIQPEQEEEEESKAGLGVADEEQIGNSMRKEAALLEIIQTDYTDGEKALPHPNDHVIQIKPVFGETIKEEREVRRGVDMDRQEIADKNGLAERQQEKKVEAEGTDLRNATVEANYGEVLIKEGSIGPVGRGVDHTDEKEQVALEDFEHNEEDQAVLRIPGPHSKEGNTNFQESRPENQPPTPNPSFGACPTKDDTLLDEKSNHNSRIITSNPRFLKQNHGRIQPTIDMIENDVFAEYHQDKGGKPKRTRDAVEDKNEQGLEAWKIGAIFTVVFLVLETVVIIIYVLKCRNKKSTPGVEGACEEGCVEPEAAMGGDCSDDTQPEDSRNSQEIAGLDPSDVASTLAIKMEKQKDEHAVVMSNCSPSSTEMLPRPDSSQDFRTSV